MSSSACVSSAEPILAVCAAAAAAAAAAPPPLPIRCAHSQAGVTQRAFNLEQTAFAIDSMKEAKDHVAVMKASTAGLRTAAEDFDIGEVEDLADGACVGGVTPPHRRHIGE